MIPHCDAQTAVDRLRSGAASIEVERAAGQTHYRLRLSDGSILYLLNRQSFWHVVDRAPLIIVFARSRPTHLTVYRYDFSAQDGK